MECNKWTQADKMKYLVSMAARVAEESHTDPAAIRSKKQIGCNEWSADDKNKYLEIMAFKVNGDGRKPEKGKPKRTTAATTVATSPRNRSPARASSPTKGNRIPKKAKPLNKGNTKVTTIAELQQNMDQYTSLIETVISRMTETQERLMRQFEAVIEATHIQSPAQIKSSNTSMPDAEDVSSAAFSGHNGDKSGCNTTLPGFADVSPTPPVVHREPSSGTPADPFQGEDALPECEPQYVSRQIPHPVFPHAYYYPPYYFQAMRSPPKDELQQYPVSPPKSHPEPANQKEVRPNGNAKRRLKMSP
eukprot:TRINITY_DN1444_c2_g1_i1.p1 TRINITY_DN1444_c2_g1~~TRINITY_DN1444_c2_g1_i1.p1  ORF type:complete len:304 (+),score=40.96 TRINITY_DN1444_c2_g1_i1:51-962(+)